MPAKPILKPLAPTPAPIRHRVLPPVTPVPDRTVPDQSVLATTPVVHPETPVAAVSTTRRQQALSVTQEIQKNLAIMKKAFLRVVILLGQVRAEELYAELGYATIEVYAAAQLGLKRSSLSMYLRVYDWMHDNHPAWLKPGAKVKLADLEDVNALIWIEKELARESLPADKKVALQGLKKKAIEGTLHRSEVRGYKAGGNKIAGGNRAFLSKLRQLRKRGAELDGLPDGVVAHMDAAIDILQRTVVVAKKEKRKASKRATAPKQS